MREGVNKLLTNWSNVCALSVNGETYDVTDELSDLSERGGREGVVLNRLVLLLLEVIL